MKTHRKKIFFSRHRLTIEVTNLFLSAFICYEIFFVYPLLIPFTAARRRANRTRRLKNKSVNPRTSPWGNKSIKISFQNPEKTSFVFPQQSFFAYVFGLTNSKDDDRLKNERFGKLINLSFFFFGFSSCIIEYY